MAGITAKMAPAYYKFPSGVQVIEISRYLTGNAAQALQYIARSSRTDGVNKTDSPLEDLMKARDCIVDEIARIQELQDASIAEDAATVFARLPRSRRTAADYTCTWSVEKKP